MARTKRSKKYNEDEISNLPNTILVHILSFLTTIEAVRTSLLSKRWENLWKSVPNLQLDSRSFHKLTTFNKFVRHVLSNRDDDCNVDEIRFRRRGNVDESLTNRVIKYAVAHHVKSLCIELDLAQFCPLPVLLSCQSIKTLELGNFCHVSLSESSLFNSLTELNLWDCSFGKGYYNKFDCFDPLASCINLKTLYMYRCQFWGTKILKISLPKLVNLTITCMRHCWELSEDTKVEIVAPKLSFFSFANTTPLNFSKLDVPSLESVNIDTGFVNHRHRNPSREEKEEANRELINMFKGLHNAQSVTLSFETIKVLTMVPGMLGYHPSPFRRLKFLKLCTQYGRNQSRMPAHVISYLLGDSPGSANLEIATPRSKPKEY